MVKLLLKLIWLGFGVFGLVVVGQKYWPKVKGSNFIQGVEGALVSQQTEVDPNESPTALTVNDIKNLDPQTASQVLGQMVKTEVVKILETTSEQIKTFPAKQVKKIKIGACEELLEEDICAVAKEIECR